jgi:hypothetical protein
MVHGPSFTPAADGYSLRMAFIDRDLRAAIERELPSIRADLERLIRIPGIAFPGFDHSHVEQSAEAVAGLLRGCGLPVRVVRAGGQPAVIGHRPGPPGAPTVLLYAHHDVQPAGDLARWHSDPFEPVERDGRLYGRGAADDKAGVLAHVGALRAFGDELPVGVVVLVEGEEEYGSPSLNDLITDHVELLRPDVIVMADSDNWDIGRPALTTSLRGLVSCFAEVRTSHTAVHSGMFGGPVPDALTVLARLIATLHDEHGEVAVEGLVGREGAPVDYPEDRFRHEAGLLDSVELIGKGTITDRIWTKPAIAVGSPPDRDPGKRRRTVRHPHDRARVRRGTRRPDRRLGRNRPGRHRHRRLDPRRRHLPGAIPGRGDPGHRHRGPVLRRPRAGREPAPRRLHPDLSRRGAPAAQPGRLAPVMASRTVAGLTGGGRLDRGVRRQPALEVRGPQDPAELTARFGDAQPAAVRGHPPERDDEQRQAAGVDEPGVAQVDHHAWWPGGQRLVEPVLHQRLVRVVDVAGGMDDHE